MGVKREVEGKIKGRITGVKKEVNPSLMDGS